MVVVVAIVVCVVEVKDDEECGVELEDIGVIVEKVLADGTRDSELVTENSDA